MLVDNPLPLVYILNNSFMIGIERQEVERKGLSMLKILTGSQEPLGARVITRHLRGYGVYWAKEQSVTTSSLRMKRGLTRVASLGGRLITELGGETLGDAPVKRQVGFDTAGIEPLAFRTDFNWGNASLIFHSLSNLT